MAMLDASLRDSFLACLCLFEKCSEDIKACGINSAWVDDKTASLRIWGASLGVMAEKHASLQHRLRDSEDMRSLIMQFLEGLWSNLSFLTRECSLLLVNKDSVAMSTLRETFEKALGLDGPLTHNDDGDDQAFTNAEASSTPDSSDSESPHSSRSGQPDDNSECSEHLDVPICVEQVDALLKRLNRLAFAIRVAGTHQRDNRAETYRHVVPTAEGDFDMTAAFKEYADDVVDHRLASAAEFLRRRLASSIARRQNRFLYRRRHRTQLEGGVNGREHASSEMQPEKNDRIRPRTSGLLAVTPKSDDFRRTSLTSASVGNTTATSMPNLAISPSQYSKSDVSTSASLSAPYTSGGAVKFPPPPTEFEGDHFLCPFCSIWCHKKLSKKSRWERKHVIRDMDPFVCVFQTCSKANELFCSVGAWISHMSAEHTTKSWICSLSSCLDVSTGRSTSYDNQNAYFNHVRQAHNIQISDAEFQLLSEMSIRPNRLVFENCPFCGEMPEEIIAMFEEEVFSDLAQQALQQHISDHLYELSFISTNPNWLDYHEGENASLVSDGSAAKQLSYQSELSSLSSFSGYIEGSVATDDENLELHEPRSGMGHIYPSDHIRGKGRVELFVKAWIDSLPNSAPEVVLTGDQLKKIFVREEHEWPPGEFRYFIPFSTIEKYVVEGTVRNVLVQGLVGNSERDIDLYTSAVVSSARKLFTIVLLTPDIRLSLLANLLEEGISDHDLPFRRIWSTSTSPSRNNEYSLGKADHNLCKRKGHEDCVIKSLSSLRRQSIKDLCGFQWSALAPIFEGSSNGIVHYNFEVGTIFPYVEDSEGADRKAGGFSEVWSVRIHAAHQKLLDSSDPKGLLLAVKRLFPNGDCEQTFKREVEMFRVLNVHRHRHIIKLLGTYKFKERYHLLFPLASGNLRDHWDAISMPSWNQSTCLWVLGQLGGLTSALNIIHNVKTGLLSKSGDPNVDEGEAKFGRHGDIKPENVLWMKDFTADPGILMICDMGLSRLHRKVSRSWGDPRTVNGSPTYAPPEVTLIKPVSRAYDIWSLGCVFAEFLTWLLKGRDGLVTFGLRRMELAEDGIEDDTFFSIQTTGSEQVAKIRPGVSDWIQELKQDERCSGVFRELLGDIEHRMLCVDPGSRIPAEDLESRINSMIDRAESDNTYLLGTNLLAADDEQVIPMATEFPGS